jgi:hypothetical protein
MAYPFVQAKYDYGRMTVTPSAFIIHMAEGGGTVGYLARDPARGVSVHFVIEYSGRIVQMLKWDHAAGSINPRTIRTTDDANGLYGISSAIAVMGAYAKNPNAASWSVEIEGFAKDGPNGKQIASLVVLADDCRSRAGVGLLGHRDFTTEKACPGQHIPWTLLGGHGATMSGGGNQPVPGGNDVKIANANGYDTTSGLLLNVGTGAAWTYLDGTAGGKMPVDAALPTVAFGDGDPKNHLVVLSTGNPYADGKPRPTVVIVRSSNTPYPVTPSVPPPVVNCDDVVLTELDAAAIRASDAVKARP